MNLLDKKKICVTKQKQLKPNLLNSKPLQKAISSQEILTEALSRYQQKDNQEKSSATNENSKQKTSDLRELNSDLILNSLPEDYSESSSMLKSSPIVANSNSVAFQHYKTAVIQSKYNYNQQTKTEKTSLANNSKSTQLASLQTPARQLTLPLHSQKITGHLFESLIISSLTQIKTFSCGVKDYFTFGTEMKYGALSGGYNTKDGFQVGYELSPALASGSIYVDLGKPADLWLGLPAKSLGVRLSFNKNSIIPKSIGLGLGYSWPFPDTVSFGQDKKIVK